MTKSLVWRTPLCGPSTRHCLTVLKAVRWKWPSWKGWKGVCDIVNTNCCRSKFYELATKSFAVVHTGETALYGNIIITKGVVANDDDDDNSNKEFLGIIKKKPVFIK
jgi:hypothetical protein